MNEVSVCNMCYQPTDVIREPDFFDGYDVLSSCCGAGLYYIPNVVYDFFKSDIDKILNGRKALLVDKADLRKLEAIEECFEPYIVTEDIYED